MRVSNKHIIYTILMHDAMTRRCGRSNNLGYRDAVLIRIFLMSYRWSEYGGGKQDDAGDDAEDANCGGDGGDEHWYMGRTQCFRPNVAYTLYGVKKGVVVPQEGACSRKHYINSFFTNYGIESFGDSIGFAYANYGAYTSCTTEEGDDDANNQNQDGEDEEHEHNEQVYSGYSSYGLACSASGQFVTADFSGAFCEGQHFLDISSGFDTMNGALDGLGCTVIYNNGTTFEDEYQTAYYNGDDGEDKNENDGGIIYSPAWTLLSASSACSTTQYPGRCPDPWGAKSQRDRNLHNSALSARRNIPLVMPIMTLAMVLIALYFFKMSNDLKRKLIRKSLESDPMDQARGAVGGPSGADEIALALSASFARTITGLTARTRSVKEALLAYAEEEDDDLEEPQPNGLVFSTTPEEIPYNEAANGEGADDISDMVEDTGSVASKASKAGTVGSKAGTVTSMGVDTVASEANTVTISVDGTIATAPAVLSPRERSVAAPLTTDDDDEGVMVENNDAVANAMLAEKGILPPRAPKVEDSTKKTKMKRPRLAKIAKLLFRGRRKSLAVSANRAGA
jgi:hypothetical protein